MEKSLRAKYHCISWIPAPDGMCLYSSTLLQPPLHAHRSFCISKSGVGLTINFPVLNSLIPRKTGMFVFATKLLKCS